MNGFKEDNCTVIRQPFVIDDNKGSTKVENTSDCHAQPMRLGYLGRFSHEKGTKLLRELIEKLQNQENFQFEIACPENNDNCDYTAIKKLSITITFSCSNEIIF